MSVFGSHAEIWLNSAHDSGAELEELYENRLYTGFLLALEKALARHEPNVKLPSEHHIRALMSLAITERLSKTAVKRPMEPSISKRSLVLFDSIRSSCHSHASLASGLRSVIIKPLALNQQANRKMRRRKVSNSEDRNEYATDDDNLSEGDSTTRGAKSANGLETQNGDNHIDEHDEKLRDLFDGLNSSLSFNMENSQRQNGIESLTIPDPWGSAAETWSVIEWSLSLSTSTNPCYLKRWNSSLKYFLRAYIDLLEGDLEIEDSDEEPILEYLLVNPTVALQAIFATCDENGNPQCDPPFKDEPLSAGSYSHRISGDSMELRSRLLDLVIRASSESSHTQWETLMKECASKAAEFSKHTQSLALCSKRRTTIWRLIWYSFLVRANPLVDDVCLRFCLDPHVEPRSLLAAVLDRPKQMPLEAKPWDVICILSFLLDAIMYHKTIRNISPDIIKAWNNRNWIMDLESELDGTMEEGDQLNELSLAISTSITGQR